MSLDYSADIPGSIRTPSRGRVPYAQADIEEFLAQDEYRFAKVTIEGREPKNMAQSFRLYLKKHPDVAERVKVHFVGGELYLERIVDEG